MIKRIWAGHGLTKIWVTVAFVAHALLSVCFVALPVLTGLFLKDTGAQIVLISFLMTQISLIAYIILKTREGSRWLSAILALPATLWTMWCVFIGGMAYTNSWL